MIEAKLYLDPKRPHAVIVKMPQHRGVIVVPNVAGGWSLRCRSVSHEGCRGLREVVGDAAVGLARNLGCERLLRAYD